MVIILTGGGSLGGGPAAIQHFIKINQPDSGANSGGE